MVSAISRSVPQKFHVIDGGNRVLVFDIISASIPLVEDIYPANSENPFLGGKLSADKGQILGASFKIPSCSSFDEIGYWKSRSSSSILR